MDRPSSRQRNPAPPLSHAHTSESGSAGLKPRPTEAPAAERRLTLGTRRSRTRKQVFSMPLAVDTARFRSFFHGHPRPERPLIFESTAHRRSRIVNPTTVDTIPPATRSAGPPATPDFEAIKTRQQATWASGDFGQIGVRLQIVGESLCEAVGPARRRAGARRGGRQRQRLARGGAALRRGDVDRLRPGPARAGTPARRGRRAAHHFQVADAEQLPFADESVRRGALDLRRDVRAEPGAAPRAELLRVVQPGGRIGLANWTPEGFIGGSSA